MQHPAHKPITSHQKPLLIATQQVSGQTRAFLNRLIILGFIVLEGYCLARSIQHKRVMGVILALTSLGAGIYYLYLLAKVKEERAK